MTDLEEAGFVMSLLALAGIAVMADRPLEAACERVLEWFKPRLYIASVFRFFHLDMSSDGGGVVPRLGIIPCVR
jgi:hypothetical protein